MRSLSAHSREISKDLSPAYGSMRSVSRFSKVASWRARPLKSMPFSVALVRGPIGMCLPVRAPLLPQGIQDSQNRMLHREPHRMSVRRRDMLLPRRSTQQSVEQDSIRQSLCRRMDGMEQLLLRHRGIPARSRSIPRSANYRRRSQCKCVLQLVSHGRRLTYSCLHLVDLMRRSRRKWIRRYRNADFYTDYMRI